MEFYMIISCRFKSLILAVILVSLSVFGAQAQIQRNMCRECQAITEVDATHCPDCNAVLNLCLECKTPNPINLDFCMKCNAPLAEMRVLNSIDEETREKLKLGRSERAELERELMRINFQLEKNPEKAEQLLFRKGKVLHRMDFFSQEAQTWRAYLEKYPETPRKLMIKIYLADALRKWGYLFYSQKNITRALELIKEATEVNPASQDAWQWLGRIYMEKNQNEEAKEAYMNALKAEPGDKTSIHFLKKLKVSIPQELLKKAEPQK